MFYLPAALGLILVFSLSLNAYLFFYARSLRRKPAPTVEAKDLLHDLTRRGQAILRVEVIDPAGLLLRSPRG